MYVIWLLIALVLIIFEIVTLTFFLFWLALAAFSASLIALFSPDSFVLQTIVFTFVAIILTFFAKPLLNKRMKRSKGFQDSFQTIVGKDGEVIEAIPKHGYGIVKIGSQTWSAEADVSLNQGDMIVVVARENTFLKVAQKEEK